MKHPPLVRILRTAVTVLATVAVIVPVLLHLFDSDANGVALVAMIGATQLVITTIAAAIDKAGPAPVLRTVGQVVVALAAIVPAVVAALSKGGIHVDETQLAAIAGAAVVIVSAIQNGLEHAGTIPTLGAGLVVQS